MEYKMDKLTLKDVINKEVVKQPNYVIRMQDNDNELSKKARNGIWFSLGLYL